VWLAPLQVVVANITGRAAQYVTEVVKALQKTRELGPRPDLRNEKITYKIREQSMQKAAVHPCRWRQGKGEWAALRYAPGAIRTSA
jgi:threonyl-tRNA synthetase